MELLPAIKNGQTSYIFNINLLDSASSTGGGKTGLTNATSGLLISTIADNEVAPTVYTGGSTIQIIATIGTYVAPAANNCRFIEVNAANNPGLYQIQLADARYAVANAKVLYCTISGAFNLVPKHFAIPLVADDPYVAKPTTAQIATGVWTDTTPGDFTVALSIGKSVMNGVALGSALHIALTDALTTYTGNTPQTGDTFARIGALGAGLTALAPSATALSTVQWTNARSANLDNLDTAVSTRLASVSYTAPDNAGISFIATLTDATLDAAMTSRAPASNALSNVQWTNARAANLDNLDSTISSRAPASTALSDVQWTNARAAALDDLSPIKTKTDQLTFTASNTLDANAVLINGSAQGASNLGKTTAAIGRGTVAAGATTTSLPTSAFSLPVGSVNQFEGRTVLFADDTTTPGLAGASSVIGGSTNSATPTLSVAALPDTPVAGDTFTVV